MKMKKYCVEQSENLDELIDGVNILLEAGWVLQGGIAYCEDSVTFENERKGGSESIFSTTYLQALSLPIASCDDL